MIRRVFLITVVILAALALVGCEGYENYTPSAVDLTRIAEEMPPGPTKDAVQATAVARYVEAEMLRQEAQAAQATADAANLEHSRRVAEMTAEAQAQERARADAAQATRQALDAHERTNSINATATAHTMNLGATATADARAVVLQATMDAQNATATIQAQHATATQHAQEATIQAQHTTATAVAVAVAATADQANVNATATVQTRYDQATTVSLQATGQAINLAAQRGRWMNPLQFLGTVLLVAFLGAGAVFIGLRAWTLIEDRGRVVRRSADEGEPLILINRERLAMPMRMFGPYADLTQGEERAPLLAPTAEDQAGTTKRQQAANVLQAQQAGEIARAKNSGKNGGGRLVTALPPGRGNGTPRPDAPTIRVVDPNQVRPWIEDVEGQLLAEVSR